MNFITLGSQAKNKKEFSLNITITCLIYTVKIYSENQDQGNLNFKSHGGNLA